MLYLSLIGLILTFCNMTGYCVKCKMKDVEMKDAKPVTKDTKRGPVNFMVGKCPKCDCAMWRVVSRGPKKA